MYRTRSDGLSVVLSSELGLGGPIAFPRPIDGIKGDSGLAEWHRGADIVQIPLLPDRGSSWRVNIFLGTGPVGSGDPSCEPGNRAVVSINFPQLSLSAIQGIETRLRPPTRNGHCASSASGTFAAKGRTTIILQIYDHI